MVKDLKPGSNVLIVSHGNTLRAMISLLEQLSPEEAAALSVPRCNPLQYRFNVADGAPSILPFDEPHVDALGYRGQGRWLSSLADINNAAAQEQTSLHTLPSTEEMDVLRDVKWRCGAATVMRPATVDAAQFEECEMVV